MRTSESLLRGPQSDHADGPGEFYLGATRIRAELLMLGFRVSQAVVSRYLYASGRQRTLLWRTFLRNQAIAIGRYPAERSIRHERLHKVRRIGLQFGRSDRSAMRGVRRPPAVSVGLEKVSTCLPTAVSVRSPPRQTRVSPRPRRARFGICLSRGPSFAKTTQLGRPLCCERH
jgi:hypothetical protein